MIFLSEHYGAIKNLHILTAVLSISLFCWRFVRLMRIPTGPQQRWIRVLPHVNDTLLLTFAIGRLVFLPRVALAGALITALLPILPFFETQLLGETWTTPLTMGSLLLVLRVVAGKTKAVGRTQFFAGLLMPFLTDYGLMEFVGTLLKRIFRRLFTLPGRSAIDALASWMSSAPVGVLITIQQYTSGHYTAREASVIATNFSVVSVPFALLVAKTVGVGDRFPEYYMAVVITGVITAMIMPRIPPLSRFKDTPFDKLHPLRETLVSAAPEAWTGSIGRPTDPLARFGGRGLDHQRSPA